MNPGFVRGKRLSRRALLQGLALTPALPLVMRTAAASIGDTARSVKLRAVPLPLAAVRLTPSPFLAAVEANRRYLITLEPNRLLHNFRTNAGLPVRGEIYGGWESESLAGHTLGHYLSACSLMYAQVGEVECRRRVDYIVDELAACQAANGDGYVGGFTRKRNDQVEDGKRIFPELVQGDIRSAPFNLNGVWSPLYTVHKLLAGLLDAERYCGNDKARGIALGMSAYLDRVFAQLSDTQVQQVLDTEYGGVTESFAELYARTGDERWLKLSQRLYHHRILDPLAAERDELSGLHSNTQIPKLVSEARLYELTGDERHAVAARFFWRTVTRNRSYVIGGNSDRENFELPLSKYVTEQTCETCNTHNMLKLTRHLYSWRPDAAYFDYYERAHFNHILAHHRPDTGMFTYMMPVMAGGRREFSTPANDFWCCVGTGLESHSKHGDSIYWQDDDRLYVNLYIPSELDWQERAARLDLATGYPFSEDIDLQIRTLRRPQSFAIALRIPGWCENAGISVNGRTAMATRLNGYAVIRRRWRSGDRVRLKLPGGLRCESIGDDPDTIAFLNGPLVLAADLGAADTPFDDLAPALVGTEILGQIRPVRERASEFDMGAVSRPANLALKPFFQQYDRRTALYFRRLTQSAWDAERAAFAAERARIAALEARAIDILYPGDAKSEAQHGVTGPSETLLYRGRNSRLARKGGWFEFRMKCGPGPLSLQSVYRGDERNRRLRVLVEGTAIASERFDGDRGALFLEQSYAIPIELTGGKSFIVVRFEADKDFGTGPIYGCRLLASKDVAPISA